MGEREKERERGEGGGRRGRESSLPAPLGCSSASFARTLSFAHLVVIIRSSSSSSCSDVTRSDLEQNFLLLSSNFLGSWDLLRGSSPLTCPAGWIGRSGFDRISVRALRGSPGCEQLSRDQCGTLRGRCSL